MFASAATSRFCTFADEYMRIGIVTFHNADNYGAVLQAYALQTHLRKCGHDPFFINYRYVFEEIRKPHLANIVTAFPKKSARSVLELYRSWLLQKPFKTFRKTHLMLGDVEYHSYDQVVKQPQLVDVLVCGSDQIWSPMFTAHVPDQKMSWLDFWGNSIRRIAYAGSFSTEMLPSNSIQRLSVYVKRFCAVGVREKSGIEIMSTIGRKDAVWVPDPTLLLNAYDYQEIAAIKKATAVARPIAMFIRWKTRDLEEAGNYLSLISGQKLLLIFVSSFSWLFTGGRNGPAQWLEAIASAPFVMTDSYHALMFCLVFQRPFIVLLWNGDEAGKNVRVLSILEKLGLAHRAIERVNKAQMAYLYKEPIDWKSVDSKMKTFRKVGVDFLSAALA